MKSKRKEFQDKEIDAVVFVYGTLMKGFHNHHLMERPGVEYIGPASTMEKFNLFSNGIIPFVVDGEHTIIHGEAYRVKSSLALRNMDTLEGHPYNYKRTPVEIQLIAQDGEIVPAFIYVFQHPKHLVNAIHITDGNFRKHPSTIQHEKWRQLTKRQREIA